MFRQIQIGVGALVLLGTLGSYVWHPMFWLSSFVGAGLIFAGGLGFCWYACRGTSADATMKLCKNAGHIPVFLYFGGGGQSYRILIRVLSEPGCRS